MSDACLVPIEPRWESRGAKVARAVVLVLRDGDRDAPCGGVEVRGDHVDVAEHSRGANAAPPSHTKTCANAGLKTEHTGIEMQTVIVGHLRPA